MKARNTIQLLAAAVYVLMVLTACDNGAAADDQAAGQVVGTWAGQVDGVGLVLDVKADKNYTTTIRTAGADAMRERGTWSAAAGRFITTPATCEEADQAGAPLHLVACTGPDSVAVNIERDTWTLNFLDDDQVITFQLKRI